MVQKRNVQNTIQTRRLPALCTPITPFPADRTHRLRSEFSGFCCMTLLAIVWSFCSERVTMHSQWDWLIV